MRNHLKLNLTRFISRYSRLNLSKTMKNLRLSFIIALFLFLPSSLFADRYLVEGKIGYFRPFSADLRDIYSDGWANYQIEAAYSPFSDCNPCWWSQFFAWGGVNYLYDKGETRSGIEDDETDIQLYGATLGIKYIQTLPCNTRVYGGAGFRYIFLRIDNHDDSIDRRERADGLGGVFNLGLILQPYRCFVIDFYTDVTLKHFSESEFTKQNNEVAEGIDVSGITFGVGVGILF